MTSLIVIGGATATGKSEVAFQLAKELRTEIISFDSVQVYKELNIGTAKPPADMRKAVPHHLIDLIVPTQNFSAGDFRREALECIENLSDKKYVILVGGTGFYIQALLLGMYDVPPADAAVKKKIQGQLEKKGLEFLFEELKRKDPQYASKIHGHDQYRIVRALELLENTGKTVSEIKEKFQPEPLPNSILKFGLRRKREVLREAVETRTDFMLASGLVNETIEILERYPGQEVRPLSSVGYKETVAVLREQMPQKLLKDEIVKNTMALAKRQSTWFKRDKDISWLDPDELGVSGAVAEILKRCPK